MAKEKIVVEGGTPLAGEVHISGAKNSALKLIAAALLGQGESVIHNVPLISDIVVMSKVIETLGGSVRRDGHTLHVDIHFGSWSLGGSFRQGSRCHAGRLQLGRS